MSQTPSGGDVIGSTKVLFGADTTGLEQGAARAVAVTEAAAARINQATTTTTGPYELDNKGPYAVLGPSVEEMNRAIPAANKHIEDAAKSSMGLVESLNLVRKSVLSVFSAFLGWGAIAAIIGGVAGAIGTFALGIERSFTKVGKSSEEAARKIEDPLLKSLGKLEKHKDNTLKLNFTDANDAIGKLPALQEELDGLLTQMGPLEGLWDWVKSDDQTIQKRIDRIKELQEAIKRGTDIGNRAGLEERRIQQEEEAATAREMGDAAVKLYAEEAKKKNDLDTALANELIQKKRAAEDATLEGIDLINQQERRAFEELEALKARDTEGRFESYIQEAYIATRKEYDFKRQKHTEEEDKKRADRAKEDSEITQRINKEMKQREQAMNKVFAQAQQQAASLFSPDKLGLQIEALGRIMERVANNTRNSD